MKNILKKIFVDGFRGMTLGLFATLILGTAVCQIGTWIGGNVGAQLFAIGNIARTLTGAGIGVGVAAMYKANSLVTVSAAVAGMAGAFHGMVGVTLGMTGEPFGAFIAAYIAIQIGMLVAGRTSLSIIITPVVSILTGALVGYFVGPYITRFVYWLGSLANYNVAQSPVIGGIIVSALFAMFAAMPVNLVAIAVSLNLSGVAAGAATIGVCCSMVGFAVAGYRENKLGGVLALGLGTSMLEFPNIIKRPLIWIPSVIAAAILGPVGAALLHMTNTATGACAGSLILIGQFTTWQCMVPGTPGPIVIIEIVLMHFLLPGMLALSISEVMRKLNWIKKGDMRLEA
ncbi:MAG: PTS transporter subunit IIC [Lachnospiraceae bacterium]